MQKSHFSEPELPRVGGLYREKKSGLEVRVRELAVSYRTTRLMVSYRHEPSRDSDEPTMLRTILDFTDNFELVTTQN